MDLKEFMERFIDLVEDIPFGNSDWQNRFVVVDHEMFPHRAYRHASLRIIDRLNALMNTYYELKKRAIEIKKLERRLEKEEDELERELIQLEIERLKSMDSYTRKLIKDAIREILSLLPVVESVGKMSREEFERMEKSYFEERYVRLCRSNMNIDLMLGLEIVNSQEDLYQKITNVSWEEQLKALKDNRYVLSEKNTKLGSLFSDIRKALKSVEESVGLNKEGDSE